MDRQHFLSLLYLLWIAPLLYSVSDMTAWEHTFLIFGLSNIITLLIFALFFSKLSAKRKGIGLSVIGGILLLGVAVGSLYKLGDSTSLWLYNKVFAPTPQEEISPENNLSETIQTGSLSDTATGTTITGSLDILSGNTGTSGTLVDTAPLYNADTVFEQTNTGSTTTTTTWETTPKESNHISVLPSQGTLNYAQVIPYLVQQYKLTNSSGRSFNFANISKSNILYGPFAIAASKAMIGENINPMSKVSCNTYLVLKGMAAGWDVTYTGTPQPAYRKKAVELWMVSGCTDGAFVTKSTL